MGWENWNGDELIRRVNEACLESIYKTCEGVGAIADSEIPLNEGPLKNSKTIKTEMRKNPRGSISYGGGRGTGKPKIPYALRWHQQQANFQHGRKRFYLRDPFNKTAPILLNAALRQHLGEVLR